jgi:uncharacterized membrane protein YhaH (DUF805 family)
MSLFLTDISPPSAPAPQQHKLFSLAGRMARAHYICYTLGSLVAVVLFLYLLGFAAMLMGSLGRTVYITSSVLLVYAFLPIFFTILTIKRAHDFNRGGWLALLLFVPIINLCFWFIPGSRGDNRYGAATPEPSFGIRIAAVALPLILIGGYLATAGSVITSSKDVRPADSDSPLQPYTP